MRTELINCLPPPFKMFGSATGSRHYTALLILPLCWSWEHASSLVRTLHGEPQFRDSKSSPPLRRKRHLRKQFRKSRTTTVPRTDYDDDDLVADWWRPGSDLWPRNRRGPTSASEWRLEFWRKASSTIYGDVCGKFTAHFWSERNWEWCKRACLCVANRSLMPYDLETSAVSMLF